MDRRPDHPAMRLDLVGDERIAIIGAREKAAEFRFRIILKDREQQFALVGGDHRPVVGDEFGKQRSDEQKEKNPERPIAALVVTEIGEPALVERREPQRAASARAAARARRNSPAPDVAGSAHSDLPRLEIDARIDPGIGEVRDEIHDKAEQRENIEIGEDDRIIAIDDRFIGQKPKTIEREDAFRSAASRRRRH